jgi:hypothetical protein
MGLRVGARECKFQSKVWSLMFSHCVNGFSVCARTDRCWLEWPVFITREDRLLKVTLNVMV